MKKILLAVVIVSAFVVPAFAEMLDFSVFGGYTTVSMGKMNDQINSLYNSLSPLTALGVSLSKTNFSGGLVVGADIGVSFMPGFTVGFRPELVYPSDATIKLSDSSGDSEKYDFGANLVPLMIGVSYNYNIPAANIGLGADIYAGYGIANGSFKVTSSGPNAGSLNESMTMSGGGFVGEADLNAKYNFLPAISLGLKLGYRLADIPQMTANADNSYFGIKKGDKMKDDNGNVIPFDFSGILAAISLNFSF